MDRIRISAQLIDTVDHSHLWVDRFDRDLADVFALQDEIVGRIVNALADVLPSRAPIASHRATNVEAYDLFVRGRDFVTQSPDTIAKARALLEEATALDPGFAEAQAWLAMSHHFGWKYWGEEADRHRAQARAIAQRAVSLNPESADAHWVLGYVRTYDFHLADGLVEFSTALRINPNHADAWALLAYSLAIDLRISLSSVRRWIWKGRKTALGPGWQRSKAIPCDYTRASSRGIGGWCVTSGRA